MSSTHNRYCWSINVYIKVIIHLGIADRACMIRTERPGFSFLNPIYLPVNSTGSVVTVSTTDGMVGQGQEPVSSSEDWQALAHPQLAHLPQLPHPLRARRMQVSPPPQPPPPVAVELEVATTDMWCHT